MFGGVMRIAAGALAGLPGVLFVDAVRKRRRGAPNGSPTRWHIEAAADRVTIDDFTTHDDGRPAVLTCRIGTGRNPRHLRLRIDWETETYRWTERSESGTRTGRGRLEEVEPGRWRGTDQHTSAGRYWRDWELVGQTAR